MKPGAEFTIGSPFGDQSLLRILLNHFWSLFGLLFRKKSPILVQIIDYTWFVGQSVTQKIFYSLKLTLMGKQHTGR